MEPLNQVFQSITQTARNTGLSEYYLRKGIRDGRVPAIMSGSKYLVNVPALLEILNQESHLESNVEE